jgi:hypothetical protein
MATTIRERGYTRLSAVAFVAALGVFSPPLFAAQPAGGDAGVQASTPDLGRGDANAHEGFLAGAKFGGIVPIASGMTPFIAGGLEVGWLFDPGRVGVYLDVSYATPKGSGTADDPRLASGKYDWTLTQKQLVLQPTLLYRFLTGGSVTPYIGIGPRLYLTESTIKSDEPKLAITQERSTEFGVGLPLGVEFAAGPGGLFAEALLQWGPLDHTITGDTHYGAASLFIGYRAIL